MRAVAGAADLDAISDLIQACPPQARHRLDYPWRLSSPAFETGRDIQLWYADGRAVGFAAWYRWWATLDFYVRPGAWQRTVEEAVFAWAPGRFRELDEERGQPLPYWAEAREDDSDRLALLTRHGYSLDDDYGYSTLVRDLSTSVEDVPPPAGFVIRPLAGEAEVAAYVALHRRAFESDSMTHQWRQRTLTMPLHEPDLDLVAVAPDGRLAGFCVGWLNKADGEAQIEPLGIDPDYQRLGLARALLAESLSRFREHGAKRALVETETTRSPALRTYTTAGFEEQQRTIRKGQWAAAL